MRRLLVGLLFLVFVPVVALGVSSPASAVTKNGSAQTIHWSDDTLIPGRWIDCTATVYWQRSSSSSSSATIQVAGGQCSGGYNSGSGDDSLSGDDEFRLSAECSPAVSGPGIDNRLAYSSTGATVPWDTSWAASMTPATFGTIGACNVSAITLYYKNDGWGADIVFESTATVALGTPPDLPPVDVPVSADCTRFTLSSVPRLITFERAAYPAGWGSYSGVQHWHVKGKWPGFAWKPSPPTGNVSIAYVYRDASGVLALRGLAVASASTGATAIAPPTLPPLVFDNWAPGSAPDPAGYEFVGFMVYPNSESISTFNVSNLPPGVPGGVTGGALGLTDPSKCTYYFGDKIAETADTRDNPAGNVGAGETGATDDPTPTPGNPEPEGDDGSCEGFSFTDPTSWAGAGICVLVKAVNALVGVIKDLFGVLGDLFDWLKSMFVPPDDLFDGAVDDLSETVDESNAGAWTDAAESGFAGATTGPSARMAGESCSGPGLTWEGFEKVGLSGGDTIYPFDACSGQGEQLAHWSRLILTALISVGGFLKILALIGQSTGLSLQMGAMSRDWSGATTYKKGYGD